MTSPKARFARRTSAHKGVMSSIAMKFPSIRRSFQECKKVFENMRYVIKTKTDNNKKKFISFIRTDQLSNVLIELGARKESLKKKP